MPELVVFLIKVNIALLVFCAGYYAVLRRLTFYTLNRIYLVSAILFATVYPRINLSAFLTRHRQIAEPVQAIAFRVQNPSKQLLTPITDQGYWHYAEFIFWTGVILLALRLLLQFISLYRIYINSREGQLHGHKVRLISGAGGPFSFWKNIYVNPDKHEPADLKAILQHEQIHVSEWHTADILLGEISTIFYWFNPGIWLMKRAIRENIEFITDRKILQNGADSKQYQYSLVNVGFSAGPQGIVNNFNISTIKKRIIMMNAKRSSNMNLTRYFFLVPAVIVLLLVFTVSRAALAKKHDISNVRHEQARQNIETVSSKIKRRPASVNLPGSRVAVSAKINADTAHVKTAGGADTSKKLHIPQKNGELVIDQPDMYVVDGKIVKDYDITKADTGQIDLISISKQGGKTVVYVQTKNGLSARNIRAVRINGRNTTNSVWTSTKGELVYADTLKDANGKLSFDSVYVTGSPRNRSMKYGVSSAKTLRMNYMPSSKFSPRTFSTVYAASINSSGEEITLNHLSDKLIIINGKIASEADLKKVSAFDIDRMVLKTDEETESLYGDKAKNGIVFIVTKKK